MRKLLLISLLVNGALIALAIYALRRPNAPIGTATPPPTAEGTAKSASETNAAESADPPPAAKKAGHVIQSWRDIETEDFYAYMENLRRIGCPEETIADIIIAEVSEMYRGRLANLPAVPKREFKFWQTGPSRMYPLLDPALEKARRDLETERDELLRTLLGANYASYKVPQGAAEKWMNDPFFAALPVAKRNRLFDINDRTGAAVQAITDHRQNYMDEDDINQVRRLIEQQDADMAAVLTPEEWEQFRLRLSRQAEMTRKTILSAFDASEEEFRAILAAENKRQAGTSSPSIDDDLKKALGEERYAEYKLSNNYDYRQLVQITEKQKLSRDVARQVYELKSKVDTEMQALRSNPGPDTMQRLSDLRIQTAKQASELLGEKGFQEFYQNAWWLRNVPSTSPNSRPAAVIQK